MTIKISVNGKRRSAPVSQTILGLLAELEIEPARVAVELNRRIVKQARWAETVLDDGAELEIVHFVGGG